MARSGYMGKASILNYLYLDSCLFVKVPAPLTPLGEEGGTIFTPGFIPPDDCGPRERGLRFPWTTKMTNPSILRPASDIIMGTWFVVFAKA
jgi:hypothetical protein